MSRVVKKNRLAVDKGKQKVSVRALKRGRRTGKLRKAPATSKRVFRLTAEKRRALELIWRGKKDAEVAREVGVCSKSVYNWRHEFREVFLEGNVEFIEVVTTAVKKSFGVIEKYLSGKGEMAGGDLQAALAILKGFGVLAPDVKQTNIDNSQKLIQFNNRWNIEVKPVIDQEFNNRVPTEFERMVRILKIPASTTGADS